VPPAVVTNDRETLIAIVIGGAGIMRLGMFDPGLITAGHLVSLLPDWKCPPGPPVYGLYRRAPRVPPRIAAFLDFMAEALADFDPGQKTLVRAQPAPPLPSRVGVSSGAPGEAGAIQPVKVRPR
jgi:hypothetical protein